LNISRENITPLVDDNNTKEKQIIDNNNFVAKTAESKIDNTSGRNLVFELNLPIDENEAENRIFKPHLNCLSTLLSSSKGAIFSLDL
jgi:hypothetical protein